MISRLEYYKHSIDALSDEYANFKFKDYEYDVDAEVKQAIFQSKQDDLYLLALIEMTRDKNVPEFDKAKARELVMFYCDPVLGKTNDVVNELAEFVYSYFLDVEA